MISSDMLYAVVFGIVFIGLACVSWLLSQEAKKSGTSFRELVEDSIEANRPSPQLPTDEKKHHVAKEEHKYFVVSTYPDFKKFLKETKVGDFMTPKPYVINVEEPFSKVPKIFLDHKIRHLPVVDHSNHLVGWMTQREMFRICPPHRLLDGEWHYDDEMLNDIILEHVMIKNPERAYLDEPLGEAILKMVHHQYGGLPVVNKTDQVKGVITRLDILKFAGDIYSS